MVKLKSLRLYAALLLSLSFLTANAETIVEVSNPLEGIPSGEYVADLSHASVIWKVSHFGFSTYVGRFNDFSAELALDTEDFSKSRVDVDIKVDSIDTDYPFAEEKDFNEILSEEWFKSDEYPSVTFKTTSVSALTGNNATVSGELTILDETHPVDLAVTINGAAASHPFKKVPIVGFSATTTIDRTVWGISKYAPNIGAEVVIEIEGEFLKTE